MEVRRERNKMEALVVYTFSLFLQIVILEINRLILKFEGMGEEPPDHTTELNIAEVDKKLKYNSRVIFPEETMKTVNNSI